ncbi:hypothetical protein QTP70_030316 [Hemibagrus guttatus]|uniref:ribonuclease H n=1 Tax=Hemibagrus guttatus TaxID=175788 RepID=A0AAE0UUI9_9TELE|nr:hypothetical protein QTP70_030316 [Hemibagrus guttatus]
MKSGKAVGPDDIPVEVWKCLGEAAVEFLTSLFNRVLENLEKAYDRVPREELWYCMRKSGVAEKYVRVVQGMYERSRTVVRCAVGQTEEFKVEVGLHQGSALSPFLFAMVMDQLSEEVRQESPWTMMFADDIVICSESREQVEESLERWRFALERRGMKVSHISVTSPINLFIIVIYRPPGPLVLGDFNLPSDKLHSSGLLALLNSFSLSFNSCPPTHKEGNVLDLVFTHPSPATDMTVTPLHISDHHLVSFSITLPVLPKRNPQHLSLTRRNLHSISPSSVASCTLSSLPDHESFSSLPLDSATDTLLSSLSSTMDFLCPLSTIRRKNSSPAPWLSDVLRNNRRELRSAARKWKKSKLDTDLTSYRTLLSKFSLDVTSAKTSFYKEKLETSAQDPRKLHNIFSSLLNPPAPPSPSSLTAKDFASFYTEKIERICQTFTSLPTSPTSHNQHSATPSLTQLSTVAAEEVLQITRSCNPTTCPLDPIPSAMLQTISPDLLPFITTVINGSLTSGHVPTAFKKARVIPILKKPALDPSDISNYRPVSLLSFLSKILQCVVCNQLSDYLMQNNLHDPNQSAFKAAHSTETALLAVTETLHAARSAKLSSVLILLDLSAAFDTVNHKTLLSTLRSLGICGTAWEWFASYLDGRSY